MYIDDSNFFETFSVIKDSRQEAKIRHLFMDIMFITVAATLAGSEDWTMIHEFAQNREEWLKKYIDLPNGIPSHDTFERLFRSIDSQEFERCFIKWLQELITLKKGSLVSIDGKTVRGAKNAGVDTSPIHIVSAWASDYGLVLGQVKTDEKSNEIKAIPELLDLLEIRGCIVTIDAMGTQKDISKKIVEDKHSDYVLAVKRNQPSLYDDIELYFKGIETGILKDDDYQYTRSIEKSHGRIEKRQYYLSSDVSWLESGKDFCKIKSIGMNINEVEKNGKTSKETRYFIATIDSINDFSNAVRGHWGIESMHWTLDVSFNEDKSRVRKDNAPQNLAMLRRIAVNILKRDNDTKKSMNVKKYAAAINPDYLEKLLIHNMLP